MTTPVVVQVLLKATPNSPTFAAHVSAVNLLQDVVYLDFGTADPTACVKAMLSGGSALIEAPQSCRIVTSMAMLRQFHAQIGELFQSLENQKAQSPQIVFETKGGPS